MKKYKISNERQNAYINNLEKSVKILKRFDKNANISKALHLLIDVLNSLNGFKLYYDGEPFDEIYINDPSFTGLNNLKFHEIEFEDHKQKGGENNDQSRRSTK